MSCTQEEEEGGYTVDGIERNGIVAIDTDGTGGGTDKKTRSNETSLRKPDGSSLNADKDSYGVAPSDMAKVNGGRLEAGDRVDYKLSDGTKMTTKIGDFGPPGKNGEMSPAAAKDLGIQTRETKKSGPVPTRGGSDADIPVNVIYYPSTK